MQKMPLGTLKKNYVQLLCVRAQIFSKNFIVQPDVSETKLGAILCQETDGKEHLALYITEKSFQGG